MAKQNSNQDKGVDTFADLVHPAYAEAGPSDDAPPEREYAGPGLENVLASSAPRPESSVAGEVHGAMYSPQTTLKHAAAHEPGMPVGWTSANPNQAAAE